MGLDRKGADFGMVSVRRDVSVDISGNNHSHRVLERSEDEDVLR